MDKKYLLEMKGISKHFGGIQAVNDVDFEVLPGEVLGLVGENGAGKSTLIKVISGVHKMDKGRIIFQGQDISINSPQEAQDFGIVTIHQELSVVPDLSVANNIFLNREPHKYGPLDFIDKTRMNQDAKQVLKDLGISISVEEKLKNLPIASQQMVEIGRAVSCKAKIIFMDEPTSALSRVEVETLFSIIKKLKEKGVSVVFVSHRLEEVLKICDRIIVMRDGCRAGMLDREEAKPEALVKLMVGRVFNLFPKEEAKKGNVVLEVKNISDEGLIKDVSFNVHKGEIVGLAGLVGAGRTELAKMIFGAMPITEGEILIDGKKVKIKSPNDAVRQGIAYIPEDRKMQGLVMNMDVKDNTTLAILKRICKKLDRIDRKEQIRITEEYIKRLSIAASSPLVKVNTLSGGNQQKVVISKWLSSQPRVLIMDEPTRGIDVGAKSEVHALISRLAQDGIAILMISSELPEILGMSDRVLVVCQGRITGEFDRDEATEEKIMACATKFDPVEMVRE